MIGILCLFIPPLLLLIAGEKSAHTQHSLSVCALNYCFYVVSLNGLMALILYFFFDNHGKLFYKLNHRPVFAIKYLALSIAIAFIVLCVWKVAKDRLLQKSGEQLGQINRSKNRQYEIGAFLLLSGVSIVIMMMSPLNPLYSGSSSIDSNVFQYVALVMSRGGMPYKNAFDHKGPLLYLLNYVGLLISDSHGLWFVETAFMVSLLFVLYKIARLFCKRGTSIVLVLLCCSCIGTYFQGGNLTEEYAMPFIAGAVYIFLDYFINNRISKLRLILCGFCFGAVALLRINMVAIWVVFSLAVLVQSLRQKDGKWLSFLLWFLIGMAIIVVPIFIWLAVNGAFGDFITAYLFFNLKYTASLNTTILSRYNSLTYYLSNSLLLGAVVILLYFIRKKDDLFTDVVYLLGIAFSLVAISIAGTTYAHYGMTMIPLLMYPYAKVYSSHFEEHSSGKLALSILLLSFTFSAWQTIGQTAVTQYDNYTQGNTTSLSEEQLEVLDIILENTDEDDRIMVLGNQDFWYVLSGRLAASKYSYQSPVANIDDEIMAEFLDDMETNEPALVIVTGEFEYLFPNIDDYEAIYTSDNLALTVYLPKE